MRNTYQRLQILKLLENDKTHPCARQIYLRLKKKIPSVSLATVYNNLSRMVQKKEILCLDAGLREKRYDPCTKPHAHFLCLKCHKIFDLAYQAKKPTMGKFKVFSCWFQAEGLCQACLEKNGGKNGNKKDNKNRR